jgi:hypothetical protein
MPKQSRKLTPKKSNNQNPKKAEFVTSDTDQILNKVQSTLDFLFRLPPSPVSSIEKHQRSKEFPACSAPETRTAPQFILPYRRPWTFYPLYIKRLDDVRRPNLEFACVKTENPKEFQVYLGYDLRFEQIWNLLGLKIGDLSSTISLAPSERLTIEILNSQRKVLEQTTIDSTEEIISTESSQLDKEVINVARSSSRNNNWRVDGNGSFSLGPVSLGTSGGISGTFTETSQNSIEQLSEATKKSARNLKTLQKIEVRGVTERFVQNRMTRIIKNPYHDRTLNSQRFPTRKTFLSANGSHRCRPRTHHPN